MISLGFRAFKLADRLGKISAYTTYAGFLLDSESNYNQMRSLNEYATSHIEATPKNLRPLVVLSAANVAMDSYSWWKSNDGRDWWK